MQSHQPGSLDCHNLALSGFSIALAVTFQNYIYEQKPLLPVIGYGLQQVLLIACSKVPEGGKSPWTDSFLC